MIMNLHRIAGCLIIMGVLTTGCDTSRREEPVPPPKVEQGEAVQKVVPGELTLAQAEIQSLSAQLEKARAETAWLEQRNEELRKLNEQLFTGHGTSIWDYDDMNNLPVFVESLKGAGVSEVIARLNSRFGRMRSPGVVFKKQEGRIVHIRTDNDEMVTTQMGSSGAAAYIKSVAYSLTSVKGVDCVYFDIEEGDHAGPAKLCRSGVEMKYDK